MNRNSVDSSNIASVGYDEDSSTLEIEFHSGGVYQYFDVPNHVYRDLVSAESVGRYFANHIKGHYRFVRM
jgi:hypothetical protein